jgi:secreted trypsin-like serine protease
MKSTLSKKWMWVGTLPLIGSFAVCADTVTATESNVDISPFIVNGTNASTSDFPSIASLFIDSFEYDGVYYTDPYCGATILDPQHILTAAHCIYGDQRAQLFTVVVPQLQDVNQYPFGTAERYRVSDIYYHNSFDNNLSQLLQNDVAILKLAESMNVDSINDVVKLPSNEDYRSQVTTPTFVAIGHGDTVSGFDSTKLLQRVDLNLITNATCSSLFTNGASLTGNQVCFNGDYSPITRLNGGTCQGDSGGPVYWRDGSDYVQVGITSFGPSQCGYTGGVTSVFTEVNDFNAWITSVLDGNETPKATSTNLKRTAYLNQHGSIQTVSSTSESSGGALSTLLLGALLALGLRRTRTIRALQGPRR